MNKRKTAIDILLPLSSTVITGILLGLISNLLYAGESWDAIFARLGWWNLLIPLWLALITLNIYRFKKIRDEVEAVKLRVYKEFDNLTKAVVGNLLKLLVETTIYPKESGSLNVHIFFRGTVDDKKALIKDRRFLYEQERLPRNYPLDYVFPSEDNLVICDSFEKDTLVYEELPPDHMKRYNERIKDKIDSEIKWVLAIPLHVPGKEPLGVLCCFGREKFFKNDQQRKHFEDMALNLCGILVQMQLFKGQIHAKQGVSYTHFMEEVIA